EVTRKLVADMEQGMGAMLTFLEEKDPTALMDSLKLLRYPSTNLTPVLGMMDEVVRASIKYSKLPAVEEFCRCVDAYGEGRMEWALVLSTFQNLVRLRDFYLAQIEA